MISTILVWIYIFLLTTLIGHFVFRVLERVQHKEFSAKPSASELSMTGLTFLGIFLSFLSLFLKIGLTANLIIITLCLVYFLAERKSIIIDFKNLINDFKRFSSIFKVLIFIYLVLVLIAAQSVPTISDTGLYHIQNIKWISNYKVVPGLGNLHGRFAFNNHSFLAEAFFSFSFLKADFFHLLNSYLLILLSVTLIILVYKNLDRNIWRVFIYSGLLLLLQVFYLKAASSPTPDIFSLAGIWFIFIIYLERVAVDNGSKLFWIPVLVMAFFMVTVKLSAFPIALISILYLAENNTNLWKKLIVILASASLVFVPYFLRNYFLSGYLIYPYPSIDLFNPDWKIPVQFVNEMKTVISTHAQSKDWQQRGFSEWFPIWYSHLSTVFKIMSCYILISPVLMTALILFSNDIRKRFQSSLKITAICLLAIVFWFLSAPNFRFIYAFLFFYLLINCVIIVSFLISKFFSSDLIGSYRKQAINVLPKATPLFLALFSLWFVIKLDYKGFDKCVIFPSGFKEVHYNTIGLNNFSVNIPEDGTYCWNMPLPSSVISRNIGVTNIEMRGPDYKDGFRFRINKEEEFYRLRELLRLK
jgi:hypothetical protein